MKTPLIGMMVALLLVGCGEEPGGDGPKGKVDMEGTAPNEDALGTSVDRNETAPEEDPIETAVDWKRLQDRGGVTYVPNTETPFSGYAKRAYENEQVEVLAQFKDGFVVRLKQWQENGTPRWDIGYMQGKVGGQDVPLDGIWESNSSRHQGLETEWYENGQKGSEQIIKDDKCISAQVWKPNGEKCPATNLKDGNGVVVLYFNDGSVYVRETYKDGELVEDEPPGTPNP